MAFTITHTRLARETLDIYFLEMRARLLEIAATLDRIARSTRPEEVVADSRLVFVREALAVAALSGKTEETSARLVNTTPAIQEALGRLLANWRSLIESRMAEEEGTLFGRNG